MKFSAYLGMPDGCIALIELIRSTQLQGCSGPFCDVICKVVCTRVHLETGHTPIPDSLIVQGLATVSYTTLVHLELRFDSK